MDGAEHLSEDAYGSEVAAVGPAAYLAIAYQVAAAVVVALEGQAVSDGRPLAATMSGCQDVLHEDVPLLLETDTAGVAAVVHVVGKLYQQAILDDERGGP